MNIYSFYEFGFWIKESRSLKQTLYFQIYESGSQNKVHRRATSLFFLSFSYDFGVTRNLHIYGNLSSNADAMVAASVRLRGIHPPDIIQNGRCPGGGNASQTCTGPGVSILMIIMAWQRLLKSTFCVPYSVSGF
jgi:hypothetical protein